MNNRTYGLARVSSKDQNLERQIKALIENGCDERFIFVEKQSGKDFNREQYLVLKNALRENDLLIIKSIDRLGRNYNMIINEWRDITLNIKADIRVIDMPLLDTTKHKDLLGNFISDLILQVLSYVAEQERTFIKQRQKEGLRVMPIQNGKRVSRKTGRAIGRPCVEKPSNWNEVVSKWKNGEMTGVRAYTELGLKETTFYKLLREEKKGK